MKQVLLQPAYVLHRRPYRETSFLVEFFTLDYGRLTAIARGARQSRMTKVGLLQPFIPLLISFAGKSDLVSLTHIESKGEVKPLGGTCLFAGFYLNELLMYLLQKWDAHTKLYAMYAKTISAFANLGLKQPLLRSFEKCLLEEIGYGVLPKNAAALANTFVANQYYRFIPEHGFVICEMDKETEISHIFSGKSLLAIAKEDWQDEKILQDAKRLIRFVLTPLLGQRPIHSRQLFAQLDEESMKHA